MDGKEVGKGILRVSGDVEETKGREMLIADSIDRSSSASQIYQLTDLLIHLVEASQIRRCCIV